MKRSEYTIEIIINDFEKPESVFSYTYSNVNIHIELSKDSGRIFYRLKDLQLRDLQTEEKNNEPFHFSVKDRKYRDVFHKFYLLHLLKYSYSLEVTDVIRRISDASQKELYNEKKHCQVEFLPSLIRPKEKLNIHQNLKSDKVLEKILNLKKSDDGSTHLLASLSAYLIAKSKRFEIEKFIFLWMSINGLYGELNRRKKEHEKKEGKKNGKNRDSEAKQISDFLKFYDLRKDVVDDKNIETAIKDFSKYLKSLDSKQLEKDFNYKEFDNFNYKEFDSGNYKQIKEQIQKILANRQITGLDEYGFLLLKFPYKFRCNSIHSNKPVPLFSFKDEGNLGAFRLINKVLEDFLDNHLAEWFDGNFKGYSLVNNENKF